MKATFLAAYQRWLTVCEICGDTTTHEHETDARSATCGRGCRP